MPIARHSDSKIHQSGRRSKAGATIAGNTAASDGGGIYALGNATLNDTLVANNTATGGHGGGRERDGVGDDHLEAQGLDGGGQLGVDRVDDQRAHHVGVPLGHPLGRGR